MPVFLPSLSLSVLFLWAVQQHIHLELAQGILPPAKMRKEGAATSGTKTLAVSGKGRTAFAGRPARRAHAPAAVLWRHVDQAQPAVLGAGHHHGVGLTIERIGLRFARQRTAIRGDQRWQVGGAFRRQAMADGQRIDRLQPRRRASAGA